MDGIVLINKPSGHSSYDIVRRIKKFSGVKKVGHGGTLDPAAGGVLIVLMGEGCKVSRMFLGAEKVYSGTVRLGSKSTTGDRDGEVEEEGASDFPRRKVKKTVESFRGEYPHRVPEYSSKKHRGKTFHSIKRSGNAPPARHQVSSIRFIKFTGYEGRDLSFQARVSSGTYVRTLAEDIAAKLGTCGYLEKLTRLAVNGFKIEDCFPPEHREWKKGFIPLGEALLKFPYVVVDEKAARGIDNGINFSPVSVLKRKVNDENGLVVVFSPEMEPKALARQTEVGGYSLERVFNLGS